MLRVQQGLQGLSDLRDPPEQLDLREKLGPQGQLVQPGQQARKERQARLVPSDHRVPPVPSAQQDRRATRDLKAPQDQLVQLDLRDPPEQQDRLDRRAMSDPPDQRAHKAHPANRERLDRT